MAPRVYSLNPSTLRAPCCRSLGRPLTARRPMELFIAGETANTNPNRCLSLRNNLISHSIVLYFNSNKPIDCHIHYSFATNSVLSTLLGPLLSPARHRCDRIGRTADASTLFPVFAHRRRLLHLPLVSSACFVLRAPKKYARHGFYGRQFVRSAA